MNVEKIQQKVIGLDIHPSCFTAAAFPENHKLDGNSKPLWLHDKIPMEGFQKWLLKRTEKGDVLVFESLSMSFNLVAQIKKHGRNGIVLESKKVGQIKKSYLKNDKVDAIKIAKIYFTGLEERVWVPTEETIEHREVFSTYRKATIDCTRYSNRIWAYLNKNGIVMKKKVSDLRKGGIDKFLSLKDWSQTQKTLLETYLEDYEFAFSKRKKYNSLIAEEVTTNPEMLKLLQLFGISSISAYALIAVIGNIKRFSSPKKLVAYIGFQPRISDSGKSDYSGRITKSGRKDLKGILTECARAIIQYAPRNHSIAKWARKLQYRKKSNVVAIAVARKLVVAIWYVLNGYATKMTELTQSIKLKLSKIGTKIGIKRRKELGYTNISNFIEIKGGLLLKDH
jgi:transposase